MGHIVAIGGIDLRAAEQSKIIAHTVSLTGKDNPKLLYLPTAGFDNMEDWPVVKAAFEHYGCSLTSLRLSDRSLSRGEIESKIAEADMIYACGGNLKFLMDTWNAAGAVPLLREAFNRGAVVSGVSSGAMCWFASGYDDCGENREMMFIDCVGLMPYCLCPHFDSEFWHLFCENAKAQPLDGIGVDNEAALSVECALGAPLESSRCSVVSDEDGKGAWLLDSKRDWALTAI